MKVDRITEINRASNFNSTDLNPSGNKSKGRSFNKKKIYIYRKNALNKLSIMLLDVNYKLDLICKLTP